MFPCPKELSGCNCSESVIFTLGKRNWFRTVTFKQQIFYRTSAEDGQTHISFMKFQIIRKPDYNKTISKENQYGNLC